MDDAVRVVSFAQRRLWFLDQLGQGSADHLLPLALRIRGDLDADRLARALGGVVDRHEVLRTRFATVDGEPVPVVDPAGGTTLPRVPAPDLAALVARETARPLDLSTQPPMRAVLAELGPDDHVLLLLVHHIAVDGWSWDVLLRELAAGYRGEPVPAPDLQYADVARAERERLTGPRLDRMLTHWRERLTGVTPLRLPTDRPRPPFFDGTGDAVRFDLGTDVVAGIDRLARAHRATRYMVLLAVYQALLGHYTGQHDVAVCTTMADRSRPGTAALIGPFVNTVVFRTDLAGDPGFHDLLDRVRATVLRDLAAAQAPFDRVVGVVGGERDLSRHPLAQASFTLLDSALAAVDLPGLDARVVDTELTGAPMDVFLDMNLAADGRILARLQYPTALFDRATMHRFADGLVRLLTAVLADPTTPVATLARPLPPLPGRERQRIVERWSGSASPDAGAAVRIDPAATVVCADETADETVRGADLDALAGGVATALRDAGLRPGDPVGVCPARGVRSVAAMLGVWRAGGVYVPLDPRLPPRRLAYMAEAAGLTHVVGDGASPSLHLPVIDVDAVEPVAGVPEPQPAPQELAYVIFTSGSSGRPKAVGVPHGALAAHVAAARTAYAITADDTVLAFASFSFDASLDQVLPALCAGATVVVRPDTAWHPADLPALVRRYGVTVLNLPPTYWAELAQRMTDTGTAALRGLRLLILGGEAVPAAPLSAWRDRLPDVRVCNAYGPTETTITATTHDIGSDPHDRVPIGRPLGDRRVYVVDADDRPVGVGVPGELLVGGATLARGYLGRPALTARSFVPDPFGGPGGRLYRTGDVVRWLPTGDLDFLGRADDQVKIRGFRIELGEVEAALRECPGVVAAAAATHPDAQGNAALVGYVVGTASPADLRELCGRILPPHAVPTRFVTLDALPVTASGKLDRAALPAGEPATAAAPGYVEPRDDIEHTIAAIWAGVLGVPRVGIDDSFFDLGGHSLLATMAVSRVAERLDRAVELRTLFENPRIRRFAAAVAAARPAVADAVVPVDRSGPLPLSYAQERLWVLDRMSDLGTDYLLWYAWRIRGDLDRAAWSAALNDVVARHEVLRTALVEVDGRPVQVVHAAAPVDVEWRANPDEGQVRAAATEFATRPFSLDDPPMLRAGVWQLGPDDHVAVLAFHHVATDGWSKGLLLDELSAAYTARLAGAPADLPDLPVQYGDYAVWQRAQDLDAALRYWSGGLADVPPLHLPTDRPRPAVRTGRGGAIDLDLDGDLLAGTDALARRYGVTRFMVLLAAAQVVLARWTGQTDVAVGTPVAGRNRTELENLVGFFVNTVVLRTDLTGDPGVPDLLDRVRTTVLGAFDHRDVPFEKLVEKLRPERDLSANPLFQVMFDVQEGTGGGLRVPGLATEPFTLPWGSAKFDLTVTFVVRPDRFGLNVEYSGDLFEPATARRFAGHVGRALAAAVADPHTPIGRLDLLDADERAELAAFASSTAPVTAPFAVTGAPDAPALVCGDRTVTYAELDAMAGGVANALRADGMRPGDAVGTCLPRGVWSVAAMLGIWQAGGVYVPLDPQLPTRRLADMADRADLTHVVGDAVDLGRPTVDAAAVVPAPGTPRVPDPDDLAYVIFTSGSTGRPKAVGVSHGALAAHVATARDLFALTDDDRVLTFASLAFDASLEQILPALATGARLVIRPDELWSVDQLADRIRADGVTVLELTPAYWEELVARLDDLSGHLRTLRLLVTGGDVLPAPPLETWFRYLPAVAVVNTYGPTETVISATAHRVTAPTTGRVPIGRPLGGRRAHVLDAHGRPVPVGVPGELVIGGAELARGYLGDPALTAQRFVPGPDGRAYRTGDLVRWLPTGDLDFLGRLDDQVQIRGFRVEPGEIVTVLQECPPVRAAAVLVRPLGGEPTLVAYIAGTGLDTDRIADWCRGRLPQYMVPAVIVAMDALPLTVQGKLDVAALPDPRPPAPATFVDPASPTEQVTAQIWAEVLGVPRVGAHDDFFGLGGHSLRAVAVASRLRTTFDCPIAVRDVFEHPTVALLAGRIERLVVEQIYAMSDDEIDLSLTADQS